MLLQSNGHEQRGHRLLLLANLVVTSVSPAIVDLLFYHACDLHRRKQLRRPREVLRPALRQAQGSEVLLLLLRLLLLFLVMAYVPPSALVPWAWILSFR